jgi:hypothetical protein
MAVVFRVRLLLQSCVVAAALVVSLHGQTVQPAQCTFQYFPLPSSVFTSVNGINDFGTIVGQANSATEARGFIRYSNGGVTYVKIPNSQGMNLNARSNTGNSVGGYTLKGDPGTPENPGNPVQRAFVMRGSTFTTILPPKSKDGTFALGINKFDTIVGWYNDTQFHAHGFRLWSNGSFDELNFPQSVGTAPAAINDNGFIVGNHNDNGTIIGFIFHNGDWASLAYPAPDTTDTSLVGISKAGVIVGQFELSDLSTGGFIYENGAFKRLDGVTGISQDGTIVGENTDANGVGRIFTAKCK